MDTLIKFNFKMGLAHFIQGAIMVVLALFVLTDLQYIYEYIRMYLN